MRICQGRFDGRVAVVTAAGSGIGAATARRFVQEGGACLLTDINGEAVAAMAAELGEARAAAQALDATDAAAVGAAVAAAVERFGKLDVMVNNAGGGGFGRVETTPDEEWRRILALNLDSVFYGAKAAMPHLLKTRGCIVNTASISGLGGDAGFFCYNAAKGGVVNLTRSLAVDYGRDGVRVNAVCPGLVLTPMAGALHGTPSIMDDYRRRVPLGRGGGAEEMAAAILFLASEDAAYISGQCLAVDGGLTSSAGQPDFTALFSALGGPQNAVRGDA